MKTCEKCGAVYDEAENCCPFCEGSAGIAFEESPKPGSYDEDNTGGRRTKMSKTAIGIFIVIAVLMAVIITVSVISTVRGGKNGAPSSSPLCATSVSCEIQNPDNGNISVELRKI